MTGPLLAEFPDPATLIAAARGLENVPRFTVLEAFTPFPVDELEKLTRVKCSGIRPTMFLAGFCTAAFAFGLQWYSAVIDYPINSGGRPLNSWPVFLLVPFEVGIFAAALAGFIALLWTTDLPRLHGPLFDVPSFERATQDHYFLLAKGENEETSIDLRELLRTAGALRVTEVRVP
jgi:ActD protein